MNDDLHSFIEPALEARIVALILGEASAFEKEELERIISERPEVGLWKRRMEAIHGMAQEAAKPTEKKDWKLSGERREKVLATFKKDEEVVPAAVFLPAEKQRTPFRRRVLTAAAVIAICFVILGLMTPAVLKSQKSASIVAYSSSDERELNEITDDELQRLGDDVNDKQKALTVLIQQYGIPYFDGRSSSGEGVDSPERAQQYAQAKEEYEEARGVLREAKLASLSDGLQRRMESKSERSSSEGTGKYVYFAANKGGEAEAKKSAVNLRGGSAFSVPLSEESLDDALAQIGDAMITSGSGGEKSDSLYAAELPNLARQSEVDPFASDDSFGDSGGGGGGEDDPFAGSPAVGERLGEEVFASRSGEAEIEVIREFAYPAEYEPPSAGRPAALDIAGGSIPVNRREGGLQRDLSEFMNPVDAVEIPGIPRASEEAVAGIVTAGNRSGDFAINRNNIDAILNSPDRSASDFIAPEEGEISAVTGVFRGLDEADFKGYLSSGNEGGADRSISLGMQKKGKQQLERAEGIAANGVVPGSTWDVDADGFGDRDAFGRLDEVASAGGGGATSLEIAFPVTPATPSFFKKPRQIAVQTKGNSALGFDWALEDVVFSDESLMKGRKAYAGGDYEGAVESYREALAKLPAGSVSDEQRRFLKQSLQDGTIAMSQSQRRIGRYEEARDFLAEVVDENSELTKAQKELEYLDDPIRTNQALTLENGKDAALSEMDPLSEEEGQFDELVELQKLVNDRQKALTVLIQDYGIPYFDGRSANPVGMTEERIYQDAQQRLEQLKEDRDRLKIQVNKLVKTSVEELVPTAAGLELPENQVSQFYDGYLQTNREIDDAKAQGLGSNHATIKKLRGRASQQMKDAESAVASLKDVQKTRINLIDRQIERVEQTVSSKKSDTVSLSMRQHDYNSAKDDYEEARDMLRRLKVQLGVVSTPMAKEKLAHIIMPVIDFEDTTLEEALDFMSIRSKELDDATLDASVRGLDFVFENERQRDLKIDQLKLENVPFQEAATAIANATGSRYRVEGKKVIFYKEDLREEVPDDLSKLETLTSKKSDSTFSLNVSDVSFKLAKAALSEGRWPEAAKVRPEEFVNALDFGDRKPSRAEKVACVIEQGSHPFMQQRNLMRVSLSTAALGRNATTPLRLTILLDQSGSMERNDRAESVRRAFDLLAAQLMPADEVTLVGFARTPRILAQRVKGDQCGTLSQIVKDTPTEGGTNLEEALTTGLQLAQQQFMEGAQNRVILITDGAANLGGALPASLAKEVEKMRRAGVAFDACGVGADGFNDDILSALTKQGDGRYYFLDRPEDADEGFARQIAGALRPSAKNVKVQVIFNPERVERFRLYGFEKHRLKKEDFRNDSVDAAEMAAEESGVALYHYQAMPEGRGDVGTVSVRFQDVASGEMIERMWSIPYEPEMADFAQAKPSLRLAGVAALFAERLKNSPMGARVDLPALRRSADGLRGAFGKERRFEELRTMIQQAGE